MVKQTEPKPVESEVDGLISTLSSVVLKWYRWHLAVFLTLNAVLILTNAFVGTGWWTFWPMMCLGLLFAFHFFFYKSLSASDEWAKRQADDLTMRSYDFGHIGDIKERYDDDEGAPERRWKR